MIFLVVTLGLIGWMFFTSRETTKGQFTTQLQDILSKVIASNELGHKTCLYRSATPVSAEDVEYLREVGYKVEETHTITLPSYWLRISRED
jgi:hypothetical protein